MQVEKKHNYPVSLTSIPAPQTTVGPYGCLANILTLLCPTSSPYFIISTLYKRNLSLSVNDFCSQLLGRMSSITFYHPLLLPHRLLHSWCTVCLLVLQATVTYPSFWACAVWLQLSPFCCISSFLLSSVFFPSLHKYAIISPNLQKESSYSYFTLLVILQLSTSFSSKIPR